MNSSEIRQPELIVVRDGATLARTAAEWIARRVEEVTAKRDRCSIALAGGTTPQPVYEHLSRSEFAAGLPWSKVHFYFGDERCVSPEHSDSNYHMAWETLFSGLPVQRGQIHRIEGERADLQQVAQEYAAKLPVHLDLLILGMGPDGHTASLFPGSSALQEKRRRIVVVDAPKLPNCRFTITPPVIAAARSVLVLAAGRGKGEAVARGLQGEYDPNETPVQLARGGTWILDKGAAALLGRSAV